MRLPFSKNANFTGRDQELAEIHQALHSADATNPYRRVTALHGLGGIGKTQLAIQYAYTHRKDYASVWWVNASTTQALSQDFFGIAQQLLSYHIRVESTTAGQKPDNSQIALALGLPPDVVNQNGELDASRDTTGNVVNAIKSWFAAEDNNRWLLILDNYDDVRNVNIDDFLHPWSSGSILITSRSRDTCQIGKGHEVQEVTEDEALEILRRSAHRDVASFRKGMLSSPHSNLLVWIPLRPEVAMLLMIILLPNLTCLCRAECCRHPCQESRFTSTCPRPSWLVCPHEADLFQHVPTSV